jgi:hypothetical protein
VWYGSEARKMINLELIISRDESGEFFVEAEAIQEFGHGRELHLAIIDYAIKLRDYYFILTDTDDLGKHLQSELALLTQLFEMEMEKETVE